MTSGQTDGWTDKLMDRTLSYIPRFRLGRAGNNNPSAPPDKEAVINTDDSRLKG